MIANLPYIVAMTKIAAARGLWQVTGKIEDVKVLFAETLLASIYDPAWIKNIASLRNEAPRA